MENSIGVKSAFLIKEKGWLLVEVDSFDWCTADSFGPVDLCYLNRRTSLRYTGASNVEGRPTLVLTTTPQAEMSLEEIAELINSHRSTGEVYLERGEERKEIP